MKQAENMFNVAVVCASSSLELCEGLLRDGDRRCDAVPGFVRLHRGSELFQFSLGELLAADTLHFANCVLLCAPLPSSSSGPNAVPDRRSVSSLLEAAKNRSLPVLCCGAALRDVAQQLRAAWLPDLSQFALLLDLVRGAVVAKRPFSPKFLAERASLVEKLKDPLQLATVNKQLKEKGMKSALDLYFAADRVENLALCVAFECPLLRPFLLSLPEVNGDMSLVRKTAILASIQDEALRWIHASFDPQDAGAGSPTLNPVHVVNARLGPVERLVVCDESRWFLLQQVLVAHQFDALVESALLSPRMGSVSPRPVSRADTWRARRGPELDEGTFVWESVEAVLHAHAQALGFVDFLARDEIARSDLTRLFREDSVATKWMSRVVKRNLPEISNCIGESVKHVMFGTLSLDDLPNSLVILHGLFASITRLDLPLDLRVALVATREACRARSVDPLPVCSRLLLLRWIGPLLLTPSVLVGMEASSEQLDQLKIASKLLVYLGEGSLVASDSPLAIFNPWLLSVQDIWKEFVQSCWDEQVIAGRTRSVAQVTTRGTKQYQMHLQMLKEALQKIRGRVECRDWHDILGGSRKSLEM